MHKNMDRLSTEPCGNEAPLHEFIGNWSWSEAHAYAPVSTMIKVIKTESGVHESTHADM